jgi:hypothetical protein
MAVIALIKNDVRVKYEFIKASIERCKQTVDVTHGSIASAVPENKKRVSG